MAELFINAFVALKGLRGTLLERTRSERGASMVEYALLVGLIAVVAVITIAAFGGGIANLFSSTNTCIAGLPGTTTC
jgi:pilus assembly protein Flp/PilA